MTSLSKYPISLSKCIKLRFISSEIDFAESMRSSSSGSGLDNVIPLFYLEASNAQFEIPTKATLNSSRRECKTLSGLCGEISANPISSMITRHIELESFWSNFSWSNAF